MEIVPLGIPNLDDILEGGAYLGNLVLLEGEEGAGSEQFMYTSALMNALQKSDKEHFNLLYGGLQPQASTPKKIHYVTLSCWKKRLIEKLKKHFEKELVEKAIPEINFKNFSHLTEKPSKVPSPKKPV